MGEVTIRKFLYNLAAPSFMYAPGRVGGLLCGKHSPYFSEFTPIQIVQYALCNSTIDNSQGIHTYAGTGTLHVLIVSSGEGGKDVFFRNPP